MREEARQAQASSRTGTPPAHQPPPPPKPVIPDDEPLPKVPRVGMGEVYPLPPESDLRAEALYIIDAAKRRREEDRIRFLRDNPSGGEREGLTPPPTSRNADGVPNGQPVDVTVIPGVRPNELALPQLQSNGGGVVSHTPQTAGTIIPQQNGLPAHHVASTSVNALGVTHQPVAGPSNHSHPSTRVVDPPINPFPQPLAAQNGQPQLVRQSDNAPTYPPDSFEARFEAVTEGYKAGVNATPTSIATIARYNASALVAPQDVALGRGPNDMVPPRFHSGQKPVVALTHPGTRHRARDRLGREHQDGFEGLSDEVEVDSEGFVDNVMVGCTTRSIGGAHV